MTNRLEMRERASGDLLSHTIAEILLPGIATEIDERQDDDRGFVW